MNSNKSLDLAAPKLSARQIIAVVARSVSLNLIAALIYAIYFVVVAWVWLAASGGSIISLFFIFVFAIMGAYYFGAALASLGQPAPSMLSRQTTTLFVTTSSLMWLPLAFFCLSHAIMLACFLGLYGAYITGQTKAMHKIESALTAQLQAKQK